MAQTVIGMFDSATDAQQAVEMLVNKGFSRENIDVSSRGTDTGNSSGSYSSGNTGTAGTSGTMTSPDISSTGVAGDFASGSYTGSGYTGTGSDALGGNLTANDNLGTAMGGSYSEGSNTGEHKGSAIGNFFRSLFGNDDEADTYSNVANKSGSIVTVHARTADEAEQAADILDDAGAVNVNERASQYGYGQTGGAGAMSSGTTSDTTTATTDSNATAGTAIPIIEEQLQVGKKTVETGGKRLRSRIVERPVEEDLRLREERVWVERNTVNRPATEADLANFQQKEFEVIEHAEVPVVAKEARVVEEVSLGKEVDERVETIRDTVRNTQVDIEDIESTDTRRSSSSGNTEFGTSDELNTNR